MQPFFMKLLGFSAWREGEAIYMTCHLQIGPRWFVQIGYCLN